MPSDALHYYFLSRQLDDKLGGGKINKVTSPNNTDIVLHIRANNKNVELLISANPSTSRIHLIATKQSNTSSATAFCMHLRKYIVNATITKIDIVQYERIIKIHLHNSDDFGDSVDKIIIAELMGRRSNILLVDAITMLIGDCLFKASIDIAPNRPILQGLPYTYPPPPASTYLDQIKDQFARFDNLPILPFVAMDGAIAKDFYCHQALTKDLHKNCTQKNFDSLSDAIEAYFANQISQAAFASLSTKLQSTIANTIKKARKKLDTQTQQYDQSLDYDAYKVKGELLTVSLHLCKQGDSQITTLNYYDNTNMTIELDTKKSPAQNAQSYFKKYTKKKKTIETVTTQIEQLHLDIDYYSSIKEQLENAQDIESLDDIAHEMIQAKLLEDKQQTINKKGQSQTSQPRQFVIDGFVVFVGKSNLQNDLIIKRASSNDIWLHAQKIHGCHAIIVSKPKAPQLPTITKVAQIVAFFSKAKQTDKVPVDYTLKKNVSKPRGSKPGQVIYVNQKTVWVNAVAIATLKTEN